MEGTLIFVPAYHAEKTIKFVLDNIPDKVHTKISEIFISDDCSADNTYKICFGLKKSFSKLAVSRNAMNLGYGGNIKKGFEYAIKKNYRVIVILHGDGQHNPKEIPKFLKALEKKNTGVVLGSRFREIPNKDMPIYKKLGNKILSSFLNLLYTVNLSEFHTGFRAYNVEAIKTIPFVKFSNDYLFDTQMLMAMIRERHEVREISISTNYGVNTRSMSFLDCSRYVLKLIFYIVCDYYNRWMVGQR